MRHENLAMVMRAEFFLISINAAALNVIYLNLDILYR